MAREVAQPLEVTMTVTAALQATITAAVDTTTAKQLGMTRAGDTQTVTIEPAG